jgi:S-methylmethionine-dependent homocysteine/selenocysteine methylase
MGLITDLLGRQAVIILDSAMGTELESRGADISLPLWSAGALVENPDTVRQIHIDNIDAGADIITANTFRTQRRTFEKAKYNYQGLDYAETAKTLTQIAVDIAKDAVMITYDEVLAAGSIAPLEDCYRPDLVPDTDTLCTEHYENLINLSDAGADIFLPETMNSVREISAVLNQIHKTGKEYLISMICKNANELLSGESIKDAVNIIDKFSPSAVMVNCIHPSLGEDLLKTLKNLTDKPLGIYANIGEAEYEKGTRFETDLTPSGYFNYAVKWKKAGAVIIGGCCGTTPEYISKISALKK